jgi:quinol-cytochrome oxidoreductase complex cytochrome b subunit
MYPYFLEESHAVPASIEPNAQHININPAVFGQRTPSSIEPESHAKNHVTPSSAVLAVLAVLHFLSFLSPTPYNPASQNKNRSPKPIEASTLLSRLSHVDEVTMERARRDIRAA